MSRSDTSSPKSSCTLAPLGTEDQALLDEEASLIQSFSGVPSSPCLDFDVQDSSNSVRDKEYAQDPRPEGFIWTVPYALLPSFLQPRRQQAAEGKVSPTAYLDGLRGFASFFVYVRHFAAATHPNIQAGFGSAPENRYLFQLPILRLVISGPAMVSLFFIVSGYALSWAPLRAAHTDGPNAMLQRLSSGTFRRGMRLFLPGVVSTFIVLVCIRLHLYSRGHAAVNLQDMPGFHEPEPPQLIADPLSVQLWDWLRATWHWVNIWTPADHPYDVHLWTLPVEFRCSMVLFMVLVGVARMKKLVRLVTLGGCVVYCQFANSWAGWLFFAGAFLGQLKLIQNNEGRPDVTSLLNGSANVKRAACSSNDVAKLIAFAAGLYLLSAPDSGFANQTPGYRFISKHNPPSWPENWRFPHCLGALLTVWALSSTRTNALRSLFTNPLAIYLGKISYALYLVHGPLVHMLGFWLVPWFWDIFGRETLVGTEAGFAAGFAIVTALLIWASDLFWRGVDANCVKFARWVEESAIRLCA